MEGRLPDTPWHVGYAKKDEDDPRRHKARCIHYRKGICMSTRSNYSHEKCGGSSHCSDYSESYKDYEKLLESKKTVDEIARENREKYRKSVKKRKSEFIKKSNAYAYKSTDTLKRCLLCDEGLKKLARSVKKCSFCGLFYVNIQDMTEVDVMNIVKAEEVFIMNIPQKKQVEESKRFYTKIGLCKYLNKRNKCTLENSKHYTKRCQHQKCKYLEIDR